MTIEDKQTDWTAEAARWREVARQAMAKAAECEEHVTRTVTLLIPGDVVRDLSPNRRLHWRERAKRAHWWRQRVFIEWIAKGRPRFDGPVDVTVTIRRFRVVDSDNAVSSLKAARDGLWGPEAMLPEDGSKWIRSYEVRQETGAPFRDRPEVEIVVRGRPCDRTTPAADPELPISSGSARIVPPPES
jgi:hypothetical protein